MKKDKILETFLVISAGFVILYYIYRKEWMLLIAIGANIIGLFIKPLAGIVAKGWFKLGELLGFVVSKVVLTLLFYVLLVPISFLYKLFNKDPLMLKRQKKSLWHNRDRVFEPADMNNSW